MGSPVEVLVCVLAVREAPVWELACEPLACALPAVVLLGSLPGGLAGLISESVSTPPSPT